MENLEKAFLTLLFFTTLALNSGCNTQSNPNISNEIFYKRDMILEVNGMKGEGVLVVPHASSNAFYVTARGDLDLFTFTTCHREETTEDAGNINERVGWVFKRTITKKREIKFNYIPSPIEAEGGCPVLLGGYEELKGRHSWGMVDFETPDATLPAVLACNGQVIKANGVSICQARVGLIQTITFATEVKVSPAPGCELGKIAGAKFEFETPRGQCVFAFISPDARIHRLTTLGYEQVLIRK